MNLNDKLPNFYKIMDRLDSSKLCLTKNFYKKIYKEKIILLKSI